MCLVYFFLVQECGADIQWILSGNNLSLRALHTIWIRGPCTPSIWGGLLSVKLATVWAMQASQTAYFGVINIPLEMDCSGFNVSQSFHLAIELVGLHIWVLALQVRKEAMWHCTACVTSHSQSVRQPVNNRFLSPYPGAKCHGRYWEDKEATKVVPSRTLQFICQFISQQINAYWRAWFLLSHFVCSQVHIKHLQWTIACARC